MEVRVDTWINTSPPPPPPRVISSEWVEISIKFTEINIHHRPRWTGCPEEQRALPIILCFILLSRWPLQTDATSNQLCQHRRGQPSAVRHPHMERTPPLLPPLKTQRCYSRKARCQRIWRGPCFLTVPAGCAAESLLRAEEESRVQAHSGPLSRLFAALGRSPAQLSSPCAGGGGGLSAAFSLGLI